MKGIKPPIVKASVDIVTQNAKGIYFISEQLGAGCYYCSALCKPFYKSY